MYQPMGRQPGFGGFSSQLCCWGITVGTMRALIDPFSVTLRCSTNSLSYLLTNLCRSASRAALNSAVKSLSKTQLVSVAIDCGPKKRATIDHNFARNKLWPCSFFYDFPEDKANGTFSRCELIKVDLLFRIRTFPLPVIHKNIPLSCGQHN